MRKILRKDLFREIKKSFARFISIAILIGMGTTFFIGLNSAAPNMLLTADAYFKANQYQDIKVIAPVDFNLEDVQKIKENELVEDGGVSYLAHTRTAPSNLVIELLSFQKGHFQLVDGRCPEKSGELVLDNKGRNTHKIGDKINFQLTDGKQDEAFEKQNYEVVGFVESTRYIGKNPRGISAIGDGVVDLFGVILAEDFKGEPNAMDIQLVAKSRQKYVYGKSYEADLVKAKKAVAKVIEVKVVDTAAKIGSELKEKEDDLSSQQEKLSSQLADVKKELASLSGNKKKELVDQRQAALEAYYKAANLIEDHQEQLQTLKNKLLISEAATTSESERLASIVKQLVSQETAINQLLDENRPENAEKIAALEESYQNVLTSYQKDQEPQQLELGKLSRIKEEFVKLEQLVQGELNNAPVKEVIEAEFRKLESDRVAGQKNLEETLKKLKDQATKLTQSKKEVIREEKKAESLPYTIEGIDETVTFKPFRENIERLGVISKVIPFVFFFVACIITTTLILRMIDQSREQIGTLLALGVNRRDIIKKYTFYSLSSSLVGLVLGGGAGVFGFSQVIIALYSPMYIFPHYESRIYPVYIIIPIIASLVSVVIIPFLVYRKLFKLPALQLIRPKEANGGKPLWLERLPVLWEKIPFFLQRTLRNIMSYKVRMGILLFGFVGCMGLLFMGYGARNSVDQLQQKQFTEVFKYDGLVGLEEFTADEEKERYETYINQIKGQRLPLLQEKWESVSKTKNRVETFLISPKNSKELSQYIELTDAKTNQKVTLGDSDVFVTEKLAKVFKLKIGDSWTLANSNGVTIKPKVTRIVKNYYLHYVYLGNQAYSDSLSQPAVYDSDFLLIKNLDTKTAEKLLNFVAVGSLHTRAQDINKMDEMTSQLNNLIVIVIIAAGLLGLVVLYNLTYITILERKQEIAVIRVMGYRQKQVTRYIFREIFALGLLGVLIGTFLGEKLHQVVMSQVELEFLFFPAVDSWKVFTEASLTLLIIASLLMLLMDHKIKEINTVEALKSND